MSTLERFWLTYCGSVSILALSVDGGDAEGCRPWAYVAVHAVIAALQWLPAWYRRRGSPRAARALQMILACGGLPAVFSSLHWVLPHLHPQPFECTWYRLDLWMFGRDVSAPLFAAAEAWWLPLQLVYAAFYLLPIAAALLVLAARGVAAFDRALTILVGSFLASYFLYWWFPTLAPKVVLPGEPVAAGAVFDGVRGFIDAAEANPWDCFPSGHTMMSLTSALLVWRWARRWFLPVLAIALPLIASTVRLVVTERSR